MSKILLMSHSVPPLNIGVSFILLRIFRFFSKDSYAIYTTELKTSKEAIQRLPCDYYFAPAHSIYEPYTRWASIREWLEIPLIVLRGVKVVKNGEIKHILVCPESGNCLLSAYLIHKFTKTPFSIYFFDCYSEAQILKLRKYFAKPIEKNAVKNATNIYVMSRSLKSFYDSKYGVNSILLPHPIDTFEYKNIVKQNSTGSVIKKIIYTGMIYEAHYDSILNLVNAINGMDNVEFHIYSRMDIAKLKSKGIQGKNIIYHGLVDQKEIARIQSEADILFMPLAFKSPYPKIIETASPGKLPEYLASGTPILVHAPKEAYISWYAREKGWGAVVDVLDKSELQKMINKLLVDKDYCKSLIENSMKTVKFHESSLVASKLKETLNILK